MIYLYAHSWDGCRTAEAHYTCALCDGSGWVDARLKPLMGERYGEEVAA